MSELEEFISESAAEKPAEEASAQPETAAEPEAQAAEEAEAQAEDGSAAEGAEAEGSPAEPGTPAKTEQEDAPANIPIAALLDEREKRQARDKEIEALKAQLAEKATVPAPDVLEDQSGFVDHMKGEFQSQIVTMRTELSQEMMRMVHEDYDEMEAKFYKMAVDNPQLAQQLAQSPNPAKFAYDTAVKADKLAQLDNVEEMESKIRAEMEAKIKAELEEQYKEQLGDIATKAGALSPSIAGERAAGGNKPPPINIPDPLDTTFNR